MQITGCSIIELEVKKFKTQSKLKETKNLLKTVRDVSELRQLRPDIEESFIGKNVDKYI